jgi:hypothetical protein
VVTYDHLRHLADDWDGEPNAAKPNETAIANLQALEPAVRAVMSTCPEPEPDAWSGCGFWFESPGVDPATGRGRSAHLHCLNSGTAFITTTAYGDEPIVDSRRVDITNPEPALYWMAAFLAGASS